MLSSSTPSVVLLVHAQTDRTRLVVDILFRCSCDIQKQSCFHPRPFLIYFNLALMLRVQHVIAEATQFTDIGFKLGVLVNQG